MSKRQRDSRDYARRMRLIQERATARRSRMRTAYSAIGAVLLVFVVMGLVKLGSGGGGSAAPSALPSGASAESIVSGVTSVPATTLDTVAAGAKPSLPTALTGQPALTDGGKPLILYVGAEYCPFCAAQRWPVVIALSRFGTFSGLTLTTSAADDSYPNTPTLSFHGSTYQSQYLSFQGVETTTNTRKNGQYGQLDTLTAAQQQVVAKYNAAPFVPADSAGAIPFIDFANKALQAGASYSPQLLADHTHQQVLDAIKNPDSQVGRAIDGSANAMTALLCKITGNQPGDVCSSAAVKAFQGEFANVGQ
ncbi:DUF929 domain-containing protein [Dactylosporangium matsuzakiense]|uniref:DUF929 domain-containing protein n=1 Tax=Dactylosporangium matsuzakiense TaxID=53360 RepID=UPI0021C3B382|nr:DUF929 domain-containing protein [Dactylosporangium matsuzakiense]UWZ43256.1 DUF929 family protein [Dactylosporangium matsuzakiense]